MEEIISIAILSILAGLATGLGGIIAVIRKPGKRMFGFLMGFTAGVMIVLSFFGLASEAWEEAGFLVTTIGFTVGALSMFSLDFLLPHIRFSVKEKGVIQPKLFKTGMLIAIGITLHNLPEGISVGAGYMHMPSLGIAIAIAIALHNIPEGIATALPLYTCGACRKKALKIAFLSGMAEPVGALGAALFLKSYLSLVPVALAFAAGVMIFITLDELIPAAHDNGHEHSTAMGIIAGMAIMFLLFGFFNI